MKSKIAFSFFLVLICLSLSSLLSTGSAESPQQDIATPIQRGIMSEKQREHSRLYKQYDTTQKIPDLVRKEKDDVEVYRLLPLGADLSGGAATAASETVKRITCNADAVVIGTVRDKASQLTEGESFVFTDYEFTVREVLKNNEAAPITAEITVTRPGGTIILNGKRVRALDESFKPLTVGQEYMLFVRFLPGTGSYTSIESGESFELRINKVKSLREGALDRSVTEYSTVSLRDEVRNASLAPCNGKKGGVQ
jgi:hypothetical protein